MNIAHFADAAKMTEVEYRQRRDAIRATYGDTATERTGSFDQELARLFFQSGWTQEQLAAIEQKSQKWVDFRVRFGRFLGLSTTVLIPKTLTERRFRSYWDRTDKSEKNERIRFGAVARLMDAEMTLSKPHKGKPAVAEAIKATSAGGWHRLSTIVTNVQAVVKEATEEDVVAVLSGMVAHGWYHVFGEKKKGADTYRIVIGGNQKIDLIALKHELGPILDGLKAEGRKNMATMSPGTVAHLTFQLEKLIDKLAHLAPND